MVMTERELLVLVAAILPDDNDTVTVLKSLDRQKARENPEHQEMSDKELRLRSRVMLAAALIEEADRVRFTNGRT